MKTEFKTIEQLIENELDCPLPISAIPNCMGINLVGVSSITWTRQDDGQMVNLTINFNPYNEHAQPENDVVLENRFDEYLRTNYFCGGNLKTNGNPRIDLMFNCADFWFDAPDTIVPVHRNVYGDRPKNSLLATTGSYCGVRASKIPEAITQLIQNEIMTYALRGVREIVAHLERMATPSRTILFTVDGENKIRANRIPNTGSVRL